MRNLALLLGLGLALTSCEKEPLEEVVALDSVESVEVWEGDTTENVNDKLKYKTPIQMLNEGEDYLKLIGRRYKEGRIYKIDTFSNVTYTYKIITRKSYYHKINLPIQNYVYLSSYIADYETVKFIDENIGLIKTTFSYVYWTSTRHLYNTRLKVYNVLDKSYDYISSGGDENMSVLCTEFKN